jgi:uncharacterized protein (TIGR02001 family)
MNARTNAFAGGAAALAAMLLLAVPASADGMPRGSLKDTPKAEPERCKLSANVALTTEYVFRGVSQTAEGPAVQGGFDATCGIFYAGVWASNLDWGVTNAVNPLNRDNAANIEMDWYAGIKPVTGRITWDLGVIYYTYPHSNTPLAVTGASANTFDAHYFELKVGGSAEIWKDGTLGLTAFFSPDYQFETGNVWTFEAAFTQNLPKFNAFRREWSPSFSALVGYQTGSDNDYKARIGNGDDNYWYWNAGLTLGFAEKWSIDIRYWDTSLDRNAGGSAFCKGSVFQCDERVVGTLKFTY